jgi:hypothetical protein
MDIVSVAVSQVASAGAFALLAGCGDEDEEVPAADVALLTSVPLGVVDGEPDWLVFREWQAVASTMTAVAMHVAVMAVSFPFLVREVVPIDYIPHRRNGITDSDHVIASAHRARRVVLSSRAAPWEDLRHGRYT